MKWISGFFSSVAVKSFMRFHAVNGIVTQRKYGTITHYQVLDITNTWIERIRLIFNLVVSMCVCKKYFEIKKIFLLNLLLFIIHYYTQYQHWSRVSQTGDSGSMWVGDWPGSCSHNVQVCIVHCNISTTSKRTFKGFLHCHYCHLESAFGHYKCY